MNKMLNLHKAKEYIEEEIEFISNQNYESSSYWITKRQKAYPIRYLIIEFAFGKDYNKIIEKELCTEKI